MSAVAEKELPDARGHFGPYGGRYVPETLMHPLQELEAEYFRAQHDPEFQRELSYYLAEFCGRPTPLYFAERLTRELGGAKIYLKREDLLHTGAHKINNAIGQILLARRMGKTRVIAETGAGQHGVATATVAAMFGLKCVIYMGAVDCERQALNVYRMNMLGAEVVPVHAGQKTLKEAVNEAMRDWVTNVRGTHYILGTAYGAHPYPVMVRNFQRVIGDEARAQILEKEKRLPDLLLACVGGGSNAIGLFYPFLDDKSVKLVNVLLNHKVARLAKREQPFDPFTKYIVIRGIRINVSESKVEQRSAELWRTHRYEHNQLTRRSLRAEAPTGVPSGAGSSSSQPFGRSLKRWHLPFSQVQTSEPE